MDEIFLDGKWVVPADAILSKDRLLSRLAVLAEMRDYEVAPAGAKDLLLQFVNDADITEAYNKIPKW